MARGYPGAFGRKLNAPYVWIPLCVLFLAPFIDPRRPFRLLHLDLLVLLALRRLPLLLQPGARSGSRRRSSIRCCSTCSCACCWPASAAARARAGRWSRSPRSGCWWPGVVFLAAFRVGLNVTDSNVIDVGYAGVIGADRIVDGDAALQRQGLLAGRRARRHLRPGELPALRPVRAGAALERPLGRPARGARRGDRVRPAHDGGAVPARDAAAGRPAGAALGRGARLRLGGLPVHGLRARDELERLDRGALLRRRAARPDARRAAALGPGARRGAGARARRRSSRSCALAPLFAGRRRDEVALFALALVAA